MGNVSGIDYAHPMTFPALCRLSKWAFEVLLLRLRYCSQVVRSTNCCQFVHTKRLSFWLCPPDWYKGCSQHTVQSIIIYTLLFVCPYELSCPTDSLLHMLCHIEFPTYSCIMTGACWSWSSVSKSLLWLSGSMILVQHECMVQRSCWCMRVACLHPDRLWTAACVHAGHAPQY